MKSTTLEAKHERMLELLAEGASAREVAKKMGYSEGTTRVYLHNLYKAIGVRNKTEAAIWQLSRTHAAAAPPDVVEPAAGAGPAATRETFGDMALAEDLYCALGVMSTFLGPYGHVWEAGLRLKGQPIDEKMVTRRAQTRLLWRALLKGDFGYAKTLNDEGIAERMLLDQPSDAVLVACVLMIGGFSAAAQKLAAQLQHRRRSSIGISQRESNLLAAVEGAMGANADAGLAALHHAAEAANAPILRQIAMVCLFHAYRARKDSPRAHGTANAIWSEAEKTRQQLEAMGVRPLARDAVLPHPTRSGAKAANREKATAG
ncbi:MAG TPA: helix-turn-helix transcriptional regulator [Usitatibacter sp.]|jgi:DNA-binding CsgD family transcriptional regulator|nr:helix-turn-helix transcriptional regulator [Usitatibacter sp.]